MAHNTNSIRILDKTILTLASGAITPTQMYHAVAAESGTADDLTTINTSGYTQLSDASNTYRPVLVLQADTGDTITVKHGSGNITLNGGVDIALSGDKQLLLFYNGTNWSDVAAGGGSGSTTLDVVNSSGAAAAIGDVGYLDEAGEYQTTTTEADDVSWCIVVTGGANGASIRVQTRGNAVVNYTGTAPAQGDYLVTSTTAGDAKAQSTMSPEIFAICTAAGSGGTVAVLLLTQTRFVAATAANDLWTVSSHSDTEFVSTISGAPTTTSVVYGAVSSGNEDVIDVDSASQLGKMRLHNTTRGNYRLIESVNTGTNTITTVSSSDDWADTDTITIESQVVTSGSAQKVIDIDLSQTSDIPMLARAVALEMNKLDTGSANQFLIAYPHESFAVSKGLQTRNQVVSVRTYTHVIVSLRERIFDIQSQASGTGTASSVIKLNGYYLAAP